MPWIIATTLTVFVPLVLVYSYVCRRTISAVVELKGWDRKKVRKVVFLGALALNLFPLLFLIAFLLGGRTRIPAFAGESLFIDLLFVYPFWFGLVIVVQLFLILVVVDLSRLILRMFAAPRMPQWNSIAARVALFSLLFLTVYTVATVAKDTWTVRINEQTLILPERASSLDGTTIVIVSDIQGDGRTTPDAIRKYVARINSLRADLVLFAGDLVTSGEEYIQSTAELLGDVQSKYGKFAAVGDHDMFSNRDHVVRELQRRGFVIGDDTACVAAIGEDSIGIALVTQTYIRQPKMEQLESVASSSRGIFRIFVVHQPAENLVDFAQRNGFDLFAAGHTHGGGIAFGIPGLYTFAPANLETRFVSGFFDYKGMMVVVTNGLGMTLAPVRFHAPAEISVVRLAKQTQP